MLIIEWRVEHWKQNTHENVTDTLIHMQTIDKWWIMFYRKNSNLVFLFSFVFCHALFLNGFFGFFSNFLTDHRWEFIRCLTQLNCFLNPKSDFRTYFFSLRTLAVTFCSIRLMRMNFLFASILFWKYTLKWWINWFSFAYTYESGMTVSNDFCLCVLGGAEEVHNCIQRRS